MTLSFDQEEMDQLLQEVEKCSKGKFSIDIVCDENDDDPNIKTFEDSGGDVALYSKDADGIWKITTYTGELLAIIQLIWERFCYREACISEKRIQKLKRRKVAKEEEE